MKTNNATKIFSFIFILLLSAVSVSALSLMAEFDNGNEQKTIMPGQATGYYVLAVADQSLNTMNITGRIYDVTSNNTNSRRVLLGTLFSTTTYQTFYYPPEMFITADNYASLSGDYILEITAEETLSNGYHSSKTVQLKLDVFGNRPPVANFTYFPYNVTTSTGVSFMSSSYDIDGYIVRQEWFVNSVKIGEGSNIAYLFNQIGNYNVTLKVTDNEGAVGYHTEIISVGTSTPTGYPVANFTYVPLNPIVGDLVNFTSTSYDVDGTIVLEEWDLDNNGIYEITNHTTSRSFAQNGSYVIWLRVTDNDGLQAATSRTIVVGAGNNTNSTNIPPVANFTYAPLNPVVGTLANFVSTSYDVDGTIVSSEWFVNGYSLGTGNNLPYTFNQAGIYVVTLTVTDDDGAQDSETASIFVSNNTNNTNITNVPPVANFVYVPTTLISGQLVGFTSTSYDSDGTIVLSEWFVDGVSAGTGNTFNYSFAQDRIYRVSLRVTDDDGASSSIYKDISVSKDPCAPDAVLKVPESVIMQKNVLMDATLSRAGCNATITSYSWQIFKGNVLFQNASTVFPYFNYNFTLNGEYKVILTIYTNNSLSDSDQKLVFAGKDNKKNGAVKGKEDDLFVDYFEVTGSSYGVIEVGQPFVVTATVSNDRDDDVEDMRITFAIPELGYKVKSSAFDLDSGKTKTVKLYGYLDFAEGEVPAGEYSALIGASDTDTIRVKYFPLVIGK